LLQGVALLQHFLGADRVGNECALHEPQLN
jgi:hypothetical protein